MNDEGVVDFLLKLLKFNGGNVKYKPDIECVRFCTEELKKMGFVCDFQIFEDVANVYGVIKKNDGIKRKTLCFAGHCDVVLKGNGWKYNSCGEVVGDRVYGRGTQDMLGGVAGFFIAIKSVLQDNPEILDKLNLSVLLTGDEENECINGTKKMVEYLKPKGVKCDYCILAEPSSKSVGNIDNDPLNGVVIKRGGSVLFDITIFGKSGHVASPENLDNPVQKSVILCQKLKEMKFIDPMSNLEILGIDAKNESVNVILDKAKVFGNIRFFQQTGVQTIKQVDNICREVCGANYSMTNVIEREGFETDENDPFIQIVMTIMKNYNPKTYFIGGRGVCDAEYIQEICPAICELGVKGDLSHQPNEYTTKKDLQDLVEIYRQIIFECAKKIC